jgi:exodeoxyribonuclease V alpha subunit
VDETLDQQPEAAPRLESYGYARPTEPLEVFRAAGVLDALDVSFARAVGRLAGTSAVPELLAAAFASRAPRLGHVCAELRALPATVRLEAAEAEPVPELPWPDPEAWLAHVAASPLVGDGRAPDLPLVLEGDRLYLTRYWRYQQRLVTALRARAEAPLFPIPADRLRAALDRLFPDAAGPDLQLAAAATAALRSLAVISGGPGTGKTTTVVRLLALLLDPDLDLGVRRIALAAPTGKAAARLVEAIRDRKQDLARAGIAPGVLEAIPDEAATLHRLLGFRPDRPTQFRHHADNPLPVDVVVVDEASMVDLALMAKLVDAIPPRARLVLLGDRDQLASVEAGAVLGDLCNAGGAPRGPSPDFQAALRAALGDRAPAADAPPAAAPGLADCVVHLTRTFRFGEQSGIGTVARAINQGDADRALDLLTGRAPGPDGRAYADVALVADADEDARRRALRRLVVREYAPALRARDPAEALAALGRFRVLCAHRRGPFGVEALNEEIERWLAQAGLVEGDGDWYPGRPLLVTRNDYALGLFNGDMGVVLPGDGGLRAWFPDPRGGAPRAFHPGRLPPHDTVHALTVHQSQGSELDRIAVVLPQDPSPVLTRELLYTALTRARRHATLFGAEPVVRHAIAERVRRASGLRAHLYP